MQSEPDTTLSGDDDWQQDVRARNLHEDEALRVDLDGFAGPLDLLLTLARTHRIDVAKISILALADQYLAFISGAQRMKLELAADYIVMAAWLAFLKSRLLLPPEETPDDEPSGEELAARLAFRLQRLDAMRQAATNLMTRDRLGRDVFARGMPEGTRTIRERTHTATIYDLLKAYADQRRRTIPVSVAIKPRNVWSIKDARKRLERMVGDTGNWVQLNFFLQRFLPPTEQKRSALASSFGASLEMARDGLVDLRQAAPFAPIYMRKRVEGAHWEQVE
jgi:segregation and condensation protein A